VNHMTERLQAYHDSELDSRIAGAVEAHLDECETCLAELEALEMLSTLLHEVSPVPQFLSQDRFAAQVVLRLPREESTTLLERTLRWGWRLAPVMLVATWAFVQAAAIITTGIRALLQLGMGNEVLEALIPERASSATSVGLAYRLLDVLDFGGAREIVGQLFALGWGTFVPALFTGLMALAICSWIAMWRAAQQRSDNRLGE
jgi:predicted anti-sigma-YlaC factor YlaD